MERSHAQVAELPRSVGGFELIFPFSPLTQKLAGSLGGSEGLVVSEVPSPRYSSLGSLPTHPPLVSPLSLILPRRRPPSPTCARAARRVPLPQPSVPCCMLACLHAGARRPAGGGGGQGGGGQGAGGRGAADLRHRAPRWARRRRPRWRQGRGRRGSDWRRPREQQQRQQSEQQRQQSEQQRQQSRRRRRHRDPRQWRRLPPRRRPRWWRPRRRPRRQRLRACDRCRCCVRRRQQLRRARGPRRPQRPEQSERPRSGGDASGCGARQRPPPPRRGGERIQLSAPRRVLARWPPPPRRQWVSRASVSVPRCAAPARPPSSSDFGRWERAKSQTGGPTGATRPTPSPRGYAGGRARLAAALRVTVGSTQPSRPTSRQRWQSIGAAEPPRPPRPPRPPPRAASSRRLLAATSSQPPPRDHSSALDRRTMHAHLCRISPHGQHGAMMHEATMNHDCMISQSGHVLIPGSASLQGRGPAGGVGGGKSVTS